MGFWVLHNLGESVVVPVHMLPNSFELPVLVALKTFLDVKLQVKTIKFHVIIYLHKGHMYWLSTELLDLKETCFSLQVFSGPWCAGIA